VLFIEIERASRGGACPLDADEALSVEALGHLEKAGREADEISHQRHDQSGEDSDPHPSWVSSGCSRGSVRKHHHQDVHKRHYRNSPKKSSDGVHFPPQSWEIALFIVR